MSGLNEREIELVVIGAAIASNCVPCIERHVDESRRAGLSDREIRQAIALADKVRGVPAQKVLEAGKASLATPLDLSTAAPEPCPILAAAHVEEQEETCCC